MKSFAFILVVLLLPWSVEAVSAKQEVEFKVSFGEATTLYKLSDTGKGGTISRQKNFGEVAQIQVPPKTFQKLNQKLRIISAQKSDNIEFCPRKYIELKVKSTKASKVVVCVGSKTKTAKSLTEFANILAYFPGLK
jgi:hypothetical protein